MRARAFHDQATTQVRALPRPIDFLLVAPLAFNDARRIAEGVQGGSAVLVDLKFADSALAERITDFAEGVAAALGARVAKVAERLMLIAPPGVAVTDAADPGRRPVRAAV